MKKIIICVLALFLALNALHGVNEVRDLREELQSTQEELADCREQLEEAIAERDDAVAAQSFMQKTLASAKESHCSASEVLGR